ncbi:OmpA/MotB family protein [Paralcaligenes ureilyticus]|uniref:MotA/MotB-like proton-channel complex protein n=1 Tax=Paralcaligenes ureilyticus TaxID=627131 RepID=A0A4V2UZF8_9BURK|nr:flagellar motor protein MotB [Paralcaligenes ureilyticus]TCT11168.1 MotA/MotB-like proton-channel complex protein [Paralcaligenes ureilyticus]
MFARVFVKRGGRHEGESPFWISFSDLMSALMILFLVMMAVSLVSVTQRIDVMTSPIIKRNKAIKTIMTMIAEDPQSTGVGVDQMNYRIDLGKEVRFESGSYTIDAQAGQFLRAYVPVLLRAKDTPEGRRWMRSIVVEGFTDEDGTYLYNLQLSLDRSRSVVCSLFQATGANALSPEELRKVQELFLVGGYSFNSIKKDKAESRRVEFKIDFWGLDEKLPEATDILKDKEFGRC